MSKQIDLGPVTIIPKGDWNANTTYEKLNLVYYSDATYLCKVNSSTGVVPSPTSSDWMQVVKSMSAVSSVNGLTGNVIIDSVDTPDNNNISTKIANTEWVTNKTNTVLANAKSYTDTNLATTSEAIRKTVATDTKTSIEVAIDSHMQASRNEFASKTAISDMATNTAVSTTYATKSELSTEIQTLTAATSNTYATKQSVSDLATNVSSTYLSKADATTTYITPSAVDAKVNTAINTLNTDIESVRNTANAAFPASKITYGTEELEAGVSPLATGSIYLMYE